MTEPTLGDLVEVAEVDTVVRLDGSSGRLGQLVLTGDVVQSLGAILQAGETAQGAGFFVVGPFGSGKSHFLAAVGELLSDPGAAARLEGWNAALQAAASRARRSAAVAVPLVDYRAEARLEDVVAGRAWRTLDREPPDVGADRRVAWDALLDATPAEGLVLLLDELSEFLRAKQGPELTEDLRFLQFLGEWAKDRPVVVVCALQESIEEVANVSQLELARIRDRYRPSLALSMRHVEDLVRGRLVRLRDDANADKWITQAHTEIVTAFPYGHLALDRFARCYPLHPDTLSVLEGLRFLLSQQRGVVDFICSQLRTDIAAGRGYAELITADRVFDHFHGRLHERGETARLADTVVPYYERAVEELFDDEDDRALALRTVKLLCLISASPLERPRTAAELAAMVLARVSDIDPSANVSYLEEVILQPLVGRGAYVVSEAGTYTIEQAADAAVIARSRLTQARAELNPGDRRLVTTLVQLGSSPTLPLQLLSDVGFARREFLWQNTLRGLVIGTARALELTPSDTDRFVTQARAAGAEGCLIISELELTDADLAAEHAQALVASNQRLAIWVPDGLTADETNAVADMHARRSVAASAAAEGRNDLASLLEKASESDAAQAREVLRRAYFGGQVVVAANDGEKGADLPSLAGLPFERQLATIADPLLSLLHPGHRQVAPRGELVGERILRQLVHEVIPAGRLGAVALARGQLRPLIDGYLAPLGLAKARRDGAVIAPDPTHSPAVASVLQLVADQDPVPATDVLHALAEGPLGLTEPEAILVINACVQAGLLEAWRGKRRMTDPFLAVTATDRLGAGELVEPSVRSAVSALGAIFGPGPFDPWTSSAQRSAWDYAQGWLEARREDIAQVQSGLATVEEVAALGSADPGPVLTDIELIGTVVEACDTASPAPVGLRALVGVIDDGAALLGAGRRLGAVARFIRDDLRRVQTAASYLSSPDLVIPDEDDRLRLLWAGAVNLVQESLRLAADDRGADVFAADREFKSAYLAAYHEAHDRYYSAVTPEDINKVRSTPAYRALASLSSIGAIAVPDDRVKVDRILAAAAPVACRRRVDQELAWKPRCSCGFGMGDRLPSLNVPTITAMAERGVQQYLGELGRDEVRARLEDAVGDLSALGRDELAADLQQLVSLASRGTADTANIGALLNADLAGVVRDVLTGGQLIVTRDLASLREDLIGRRYTKRKLLDIVSAWVDLGGQLPAGGFIEVVDTAEGASQPAPVAEPAGSPAGDSATAALLARRFPSLAGMLPDDQAGDAFWLAAWWAGRPFAPPWLPTRLLSDRSRLTQAADAAVTDLTARADLADLDARITFDSVLGGQVAAALDIDARSAPELAEVLQSEVLFRHPVRLLADQLLKRLAADWQLVNRLDNLDVAAIATRHALISDAELSPLTNLVAAARHLAALEQRLGTPSFVEETYPDHYAPVAELISRADLGCASSGIVAPDTVAFFRTAARRLLQAADTAFRSSADASFPDCLTVWQIGGEVVDPLLSRHGRVAVLLVDAMRADLAQRVVRLVSDVLPDRAASLQWAVVPEPTRTAESVTALSLGRPVPGGSVGHPDETSVPFSYLGYEGRSIVGADRDHAASDVRQLWRYGPPISVAVATGIDERLHRTSVEVAALLDEAVTALGRRIIPSLSALPPDVPLIVLADHGFRENPSWGHGPEGRYVHGGTSPEECIIPVAVFSPKT